MLYSAYIHVCIHSGYFYITSSSPLLLRGAPGTALILCHAEAPQATVSEGLAQGPYMAARARVEPATLRTKGVDSTNATHTPHLYYIHVYFV